MPSPLPPASAAAIASNRFGLGARPGEMAQAADDPHGWLLAQMRGPAPLPPELASVASSAEGLRMEYEARREKADPDAHATLVKSIGATVRQDLSARLAAAAASPVPLRERLVHFWSNHFTVSTARPVIRAATVAYENEAIRPHVGGRFRDLLLAVARHPVMLLYLDNAQSVGPDSRIGLRRDKGLNENLAREMLELHTLGVDGGYTQDDVRQFARILTGWSVGRGPREPQAAFVYRPDQHEPGEKILLGRRFEGGEDEGVAAIDMLARHPATARFIATKLCRHFIADDPPAAAVAAVARRFSDSDGDLAATMAALIEREEAWTPAPGKVKTPTELVISTARALGSGDDGTMGDEAGRDRGMALLRSVYVLGQVPFAAPSPAGWPDRAADWTGPEAMIQRLNWAVAVGEKIGDRADVAAVLQSALGPLAAAATRQAVAHAAGAADALALLIAAPEFQRR